jgi:ABC-type transport system involved in cytochrome c biogenesis permease subunit
MSFLAHVHVFCFLASYAVALLLEVSRLWFRSGIRRMVTLGFVVAGWIAHTAYLYYSAKQAGGSPLSSYHDWMLLAAWALVLVYFYLACFHPATHFGIFFLPLALGLIVSADWCTDPNKHFSRGPGWKEVWGAVHGISILAATVTVLFGFVAGVMYLWQAQRLKRRRPPRVAVRLPSLEWLQTANARALVASTLLTGLAVSSGIVLNWLGARPDGTVLSWHDPVVLGTLAMFVWLLLHVIIGAFYRPIRQGRKVAYLTLVSFVFLVIALTLALFH